MTELLLPAAKTALDHNQSFTPFATEFKRSNIQSREDALTDLLTMSIPAMMVGLVDTFATSLGVLDNGELEQTLTTYLPAFGDFYSRGKVPFQTVSDILGMFIPGTLAIKGFRGAGKIARAMNKGKKSSLLDNVFGRAGRYQKELDAVRARDRFLARRGLPGDAIKNETFRKQFARRALTTNVNDFVRDNVAFELGVFATMNDSQTLYPDEFSTAELIALSVAAPATFAGVSVLQTMRHFRGSLAATSALATAFRNPENLPLSEIINRPGTRDIGITIEARSRNVTQQLLDETVQREATVTIPSRGEQTTASFATAKSNMQKKINVDDDSIKRNVSKLFTDKHIPELSVAKAGAEKQVNTALAAVQKDESVLIGAFSLQSLPATRGDINGLLTTQKKAAEKIRGFLQEETVKLDLLRFSGENIEKSLAEVASLRKRLDDIQSAEYHVLEPDGSIADIRLRKPIYQDGEQAIVTKPATALEQKRYEITTPAGSRDLAITDDFQIIFPHTPKAEIAGVSTRQLKDPITNKFESLTLMERSAAYAGLQRAVERHQPGEAKFVITADDHHSRIDAVLALQNRALDRKDKAMFGQDILKDITLPEGINNLDDLVFLSLSKKFNEYTRLRQMQDLGATNSLRLSQSQRISFVDIQKMLNLPGTPTGDPHPLTIVFEGLFRQHDTDLREAIENLQNLKFQVMEEAMLPELSASSRANDINLDGPMLNFAKDRKPVVAIKRPTTDQNFTRQALVEATTNERARVMTAMSRASDKGALLVQTVFDELAKLPDAVRSAKQVDTLVEGTQRGSGTFTQQSFAIGENPALNAMHNLQVLTDKAFRQEVGRLFEKHAPITNQLKNPDNLGDMNSFNMYVHARRQGWDLEVDPVPFATDEAIGANTQLLGFQVKQNKNNRDRWQRLFGEEMPEDAMMPAPGTGPKPGSGEFATYKPLAITQLAHEAGLAIDDLGKTILNNSNMLNTLMGRSELKARELWVPPKNFSKQDVVYIMNNAGEMVTPITGRNLGEANRLADDEIRRLGGQFLKLDQKDVARYFDIRDRAFQQMMDFGDPLRQTGPITGKQVGATVETGPNVLKDIMEGMELQFESVLRRSRAVYFEPEINYARKKLQIAGTPKASKGQAIEQQYLASIFGNPTINPNDIAGKINLTAESLYDDMVNVLSDRYASYFNPAGVVIAKARSRDNKAYNALQGKLGEHNPFGSAVDFANKIQHKELPLVAKKHAAALNNFTSFLTLRFLEVGHSILTLTSLAATTPAVIAAMRKLPHETGDEFAARIGAFGLKIDDDNAMFNPTRALMTASHFMFTKEGRRVADAAREKGFFDQQVAEIFKTITAPTEGYHAGILRRATKWTTALSDGSEQMARGFAFMTGYTIAKRGVGLKSDDVAFAFANKFANDVIGDYSPNNKPRIFQGAAGMPMGLFMTFMWNYYQRLFGYIENSQTRALVTQFATQASVFGAETVPGFQQYNQLFFTNWDGTANPVDALNNRFGTEFTEWFLNGTVSNIPKLFGADDGFGFNTRGDVNFRNIPTLFTLGDTPVGSMGADAISAIKETAAMIRTRGGFDDDQFAEIVQSYATNRFARNMASLYTGFATDRQGQVVGTNPSFKDIIRGDVQDGFGLIARMSGLRTMNEKMKIQAHSRIRQTDLSRRYRMGNIRDMFRSEFRTGEPSEKILERGIADYVRTGGSVDNLPSWLMEQMMRSSVDKSALDLMEVISNPRKSDDVLRLMNVLSSTPAPQS